MNFFLELAADEMFNTPGNKKADSNSWYSNSAGNSPITSCPLVNSSSSFPLDISTILQWLSDASQYGHWESQGMTEDYGLGCYLDDTHMEALSARVHP